MDSLTQDILGIKEDCCALWLDESSAATAGAVTPATMLSRSLARLRCHTNSSKSFMGDIPKSAGMPTKLISLDEASWRLEQSDISGRIWQTLLTSPPLLLGLFPGKKLPGPIDLTRVVSFRAEPKNVVAGGDVSWTDVKLDWTEIPAALQKRGCEVTWTWFSDITPELLEQSRQPGPRRWRFSDPAIPPRPVQAAPAVPRPARRARPELFAETDVHRPHTAVGESTTCKTRPEVE